MIKLELSNYIWTNNKKFRPFCTNLVLKDLWYSRNSEENSDVAQYKHASGWFTFYSGNAKGNVYYLCDSKDLTWLNHELGAFQGLVLKASEITAPDPKTSSESTAGTRIRYSRENVSLQTWHGFSINFLWTFEDTI